MGRNKEDQAVFLLSAVGHSTHSFPIHPTSVPLGEMKTLLPNQPDPVDSHAVGHKNSTT